jgi:hypothetical protein
MSTDQSVLDLLGALVAQTSRMATATEAIASVIAPAPNLTRPMSDWPKAAEILESIGATVTARDADGPTRCEYQGRVYVRRSAHDEDGEKADAIWFNCVIGGNVKDGNVKYARLLSFRDRSVDKLANGAKKLKVTPPAPAPVAAKPATSPTPAPTMTAAPTTPTPGLDAHFGPNPRQTQTPAPTPGAARTAFYTLSSQAIATGKLTAQTINDLVRTANGDGFIAALAMLEQKLAQQ